MGNENVSFNLSVNTSAARKELKAFVGDAKKNAEQIAAAMTASSKSRKPELVELRKSFGMTAAEAKQAINTFNAYEKELERLEAKEKDLAAARKERDYQNAKVNKNTKKLEALEEKYKNGDITKDKYDTSKALYTQNIEKGNEDLITAKELVAEIDGEVNAIKTSLASLIPAMEAFGNQFMQADAEGRNVEDRCKEINDILNGTNTATDQLVGKQAKLTSEVDNGKAAAEQAAAASGQLNTKKAAEISTSAKKVQANKSEETSLKDLLLTYQEQQRELERLSAAGKDTTKVEQDIANTASQIEERLKFPTAGKNIADLRRRMIALQRAKEAFEKAGIPEDFSNQYSQIVTQFEAARKAANNYQSNMGALSGAMSEFGTAASIATSIASKGFSALSTVVNVIKSGFATVSKAVDNIAKSVKKAATTITNVINKVRSAFNGMSGDMRHNFKHMITSITKYVLGFRSLFFLVRRLRKYIGEGIKNMAQFEGGNNHVNESITRLLSSLLYLKNAWATAFSPILQVVTPILEALIDKIAAVGNAFSRFLGSLLGVSTVFQAIKVNAADYAEGLDKVGGSAGKAADKTKKLTDRLAAFDDLNVLGRDKDPDDTGSGGGGGGADAYTPDPNEMFKIVEVGTQVLDKLKQMWADADFSSVGSQVTNKIVHALENIDWGSIKNTAFKIGSSIITFINGALGDDRLWQSVGKTIGEGINTISMFLYGILENNATDFGGGLATLINNLFATVDWQIIQSNLISFGEQLKENLISFFQTLDWKSIQSAFGSIAGAIGQAFANLINDPTLASELGITAGEIINLLISILTETFVNNPVDLGGAIATFLSNLFATIDWDTFRSDLETFGGQIVENINSFFANLDLFGEGGMLWDMAGAAESFTTAIITIIEGIDFSAIINSALSIGEALLLGIIEGLKSSDNPLLQSLGGLFEEVIKAVETLSPLLQPIAELLTGAIGTFLETATPLIQPIADLLLVIAETVMPLISSAIENILPLISEFVNLYLDEIIAFITAMQPAFLEFAENILPQLAEFAGVILDVLSSLVGIIISIWDNTGGLSGTLIELLGVCLKPILAIVTPLLKILVPILDLIGALLGPIVALIDPLLTVLVSCVEPLTMVFELWGKLIETFVVPALTMCTAMIQALVVPVLKVLVAMMEIVAGAFSVVSTAISALGAMFFSVFDGIADYLKGVLNDMLSNIESFVNGAISGLNSMISGLNSMSFEIPDWVPEYGGEKLSLNLSKISTISLPRLAQGAVIPPNKEFMAVLGDQSSGTNIEAPLDTIKQALAEVLATTNNNAEVIQLLQQLIAVVESKELNIGDKEIAKANARYNSRQGMIRGASF